MKLDRTTKNLVKVGTILDDGEFSAIVTNMTYEARATYNRYRREVKEA